MDNLHFTALLVMLGHVGGRVLETAVRYEVKLEGNGRQKSSPLEGQALVRALWESFDDRGSERDKPETKRALILGGLLCIARFHTLPARAMGAVWKIMASPLSLSTFETWWDLLAMFFDHETRHRIYTPCVHELREDLLEITAKHNTRNSRRALRLALIFRTAKVVVQCLWITVLAPVVKAIPAPLRQWWMHLF
jgi:hypothetical protein